MKDDTTFNAFVDWVKTKPAEACYNFYDNNNCAYARFLKETGRATDPWVGGYTWKEPDTASTPIDTRLTSDHGEQDAPLQAGTFGGILQLLKKNGRV